MPFPSLFALLCATIEVAEAAETGNIQGEVVDEAGVPVGAAEVILSGPNLAGERRTQTNEDGTFRFVNLAPDVYEITVEFRGARIARAEVRVALNTTTAVPITAKMGGVSEEIEVVYQPVVDTTSASFGQALSEEQIQKLPVGRSYQDVVETIPGVYGRVDTSDGGEGDGNPSVRGEGQYGNNYFIDGVSTRDPATKTFGQNVNFDAIENIQVFTDGAPAEYGQFTGMIVNVVTKDGGDEHHGSAAAFYSQHAFFDPEYDLLDLSAEREVPTAKGRFRAPSFSGTAGGPVVEEKLWYFTALDLNYDWSLGEGIDPADYEGDELPDTTAWGGQFIGKLTWFASSDWTLRYILGGSYQSYGLYDVGQFVDPEAASDEIDWDQSHRLTATFTPAPTDTIEFGFGYLNTNLDSVPHSGDVEAPAYQDEQGVLHGNAYNFDYNDRNRIGGTVKYTRLVERLLGQHEWKTGAEYYYLVDTRDLIHTGAVNVDGAEEVQWIESNGAPGDLDGDEYPQLGTEYHATPGYPCEQPDFSDCGIREHWTTVGPLSLTTHTAAVFLQDQWQPWSRLTINAGVRVDMEDGLANNGRRPPSRLPEEAGVFDRTQRYKGFYGPIFMPAPRVGLVLDPMDDDKMKVSAHYGQYYDIAGSDLFSWANTRSADGFVRYVRDDEGNWVWSNTQDPTGHPLWYDENLKPPHNDKLNVGIEREMIHDLSIGVRGILSSTTDIPEDVDTDLSDWYIMNVPIKERHYRALEITVNKQFDEVWQLYGAYTLSESYGHLPGQFELPYGAGAGSNGNNVGVYLDDIGEQSVRENYYEDTAWCSFSPGLCDVLIQGFKGLGHYSVTDPEYYDEAGWYGYLPYHSFHLITLAGSYTAPFGTTFSAVYEFDSGHAWEKKTLVPFYGYDGFGEGRGSRFMPPVHYVDLGVAHTIPLGAEDRELEARLDVFNVPGFAQAITYYSSDAPGFGYTVARQSPRSIRVSAKFRY